MKKDTLREEIRSISPYSVRMRENTDQKNSVFGQFSYSDSFFKEDIVAHYSMKIISFFPVTVFSKHLHVTPFTCFCICVLEYLLTLIQNETFDVISCEYCKFLNRRLL